MANQTMILEVSEVRQGQGNAPGSIKGFENGEPRTVKAFSDMLVRFEAGQTYEFSWYMGKPYQGQQDMLVSKHDPVKTIGGNPNSSQSVSQPPQEAKRVGQVSQPSKPTTTPLGAFTGAADKKDRSITVLAVMKSVIESGGTEEDFLRWLALHDLVVHGSPRD
jgi:hypothetical protein